MILAWEIMRRRDGVFVEVRRLGGFLSLKKTTVGGTPATRLGFSGTLTAVAAAVPKAE
ncbi:hypothetical protein HanRHA438_Chr17g0795001 [Helianthus annuus]|nr:hypothetical protein HanRHA438_Chr17g0795001 [Helianthus annuus]